MGEGSTTGKTSLVRRFVNLLTGGALVAASLVFCFLLCETVLRFIPAYKYESMVALSLTVDNPFEIGRYRPSKLFGVELIPGAALDINSRGMRDKEYAARASTGTFRILLLGDSITEWGRWSDYVEEMLERDGRYEIHNYAVAGWNLYQYWAFMKARSVALDFQLVLIGLCLNDIPEYNSMATILAGKKGKDTYYFVPRYGALQDTLDVHFTSFIDPCWFRHSYAYRFIVSSLWRLRRDGKEKSSDDPLKMLHEIKTMSNGRVFCIVYPFLTPRKEKHGYEITKRCLDRAGIDFLDLTPHFSSYGERIVDFRQCPHDSVHFNDDANRLKAGIIYRWLKPRLNPVPDKKNAE